MQCRSRVWKHGSSAWLLGQLLIVVEAGHPDTDALCPNAPAGNKLALQALLLQLGDLQRDLYGVGHQAVQGASMTEEFQVRHPGLFDQLELQNSKSVKPVAVGF